MAERFLQSYGLGHLLQDPRFANNEARVSHATELDAAVRGAIGARTLEENRAIIDANALTAHPVQTIREIEVDPHWRARHLLVNVPNGSLNVRYRTGSKGRYVEALTDLIAARIPYCRVRYAF